MRTQDTYPIRTVNAAQRPVAPPFAGAVNSQWHDSLRIATPKRWVRNAFDTVSAARTRICPEQLRHEGTAAARNDLERGNSQLHWERIAKANARARIAQACGRTAANVSRTHRCRPRVSYSHNHRVRPTTEGFQYRSNPHAVDAATDVRPLRLLVALRAAELRTQQ